MQERDIRDLIEQVRAGRLARRGFIQRMVAVGLTAPMASMMLMHYGVAQAQTWPVKSISSAVLVISVTGRNARRAIAAPAIAETTSPMAPTARSVNSKPCLARSISSSDAAT